MVMIAIRFQNIEFHSKKRLRARLPIVSQEPFAGIVVRRHVTCPVREAHTIICARNIIRSSEGTERKLAYRDGGA